MRLYFVRHGESEANVSRQFSHKDQETHPLTPTGIEQAKALSQKLSNIRFTAIYSSPLLRARQTAEILNAPHGLPIQLTEAIREHDAGDLEGRMDPEAWDGYTKLFETWLVTRDLDARMPNGESFNDMRARFVPFLGDILQKYENTDANLMFVGHAGIYYSMLPLVLANVGYEFAYKHILSNTGMVIAEQQAEGLICSEWNGVTLAPNGAVVE